MTYALPFNPNVYLAVNWQQTVTNIPRWFNNERNASWRWNICQRSRHTEYNIDRDFREKLESLVVKQGLSGRAGKQCGECIGRWCGLSNSCVRSRSTDEFAAAKAHVGSATTMPQLSPTPLVRERHGAQSVVDLPSIMDSNEGNESFYCVQRILQHTAELARCRCEMR